MTPLEAALQAIDAAYGNTEQSAVLAATARGLMLGYHSRWASSKWVSASVESEFHLPIVNPDTGKPSRTFTHAGKRDGVAEFAGHHYLVEHKTCSEDIADPDAPYWRRLDIDAQVSGYVLANWQEGQKLDGTLYDVVRKPGIRPKELTKKDREEIIRDGKYLGFLVPPATQLAVSQNVTRETPSLFEIRLARDTLERPEWYFARKSVLRLDHDLLEYARELWQTADEIRLARLHGRHYRNSGACMLWNRPCKFLGICSGRDTPDSDRWSKRENVHRELNEIEGDGRSVLSHSRMQTFKTCKRKHYYQYELGIERMDAEEAESLYFGSLFHDALAAYWSHLIPSSEVQPCLR